MNFANLSKSKQRKMEVALSRITGFEIGNIGGISWEAKVPEVKIAQNFMTYLADKGILFAKIEDEDLNYAVESVISLRKYLVEEVMVKIDPSDRLYEYLKKMRDSCQEFMRIAQNEMVKKDGQYISIHESDQNHTKLRKACRQLRKGFGSSIYLISRDYAVDVEEQLQRIIPATAPYRFELLEDSEQS